MRTVRVFMAVAAAVAVIVFSASAAMAVTFNVEVTIGWDTTSGSCTSGPSTCLAFSGAGGFGANSALEIRWDASNVGSPDSFLRVGALPDAPPPTFPLGNRTTTIDPGQTIRTAQIQHENNVIPESDRFLAQVTLNTLLELTGPLGEPIIGQGTGGDLDVVVNFEETPNEAGTCAPGSISICDDVFTFITIVANIPFEFEGVSYVLQVRGLFDENGLPTCTPNNGTVDCTTQEDQTNDRFVHITLIQVPAVPAPASLLLLGLGLVGAGILPVIRKRLSA